MTRTKSIIGALVLCALSICAFGAASASAAPKGLTAVECVEKAGGRFGSSHCVTDGTEGKFETRAIKPGVKKEVSGKDTRTKTAAEGGGHGLGETGTIGVGNPGKPTAIFHYSSGGLNITLTCGKGTTTGGKIENKVIPTEEMVAHTTGAVATWSECHASLKEKPETACKVQGTSPAEPEGSIATNPFTAITNVATGAEHKVIIIPENEGKVFTEFKILKSSTEKCFTGSDIPIKVTGEGWGRADTTTHSHLTFDEVSNAGSPLKVNGAAATLTETVTGFTKGNEEATVGATTESEIKETEA